MAEKNCFDMTKLILQIMCVTVVKWSRSCLNVQSNRVRLPATLFSVSLNRFFFFCLVSFILTLFFLLAFFALFLLLTVPVMHLDQCFILEKGFQKLLICILAKLTTRKKKKSCQDMSLLWNSWIFLNVSWHHDKQHTVHHKMYRLIYTQHPPVTHWRKLT